MRPQPGHICQIGRKREPHSQVLCSRHATQSPCVSGPSDLTCAQRYGPCSHRAAFVHKQRCARGRPGSGQSSRKAGGEGPLQDEQRGPVGRSRQTVTSHWQDAHLHARLQLAQKACAPLWRSWGRTQWAPESLWCTCLASPSPQPGHSHHASREPTQAEQTPRRVWSSGSASGSTARSPQCVQRKCR